MIMKKRILSIMLFIVCYSVNAQVTDTGDKVGVGTVSPSEKLDVKGNIKLSGSIYSGMAEGFKIYGDANYFGQWADGIVFQMQDGNSTNGKTDGGFVFRGFTPTDGIHKDWMVVKTGGKVGIGTTSPDSGLHIVGHNKAIIAEGNNTAYFYLKSASASSGNKNWYFAAGSDGSFSLSRANDNYGWQQSVLKVKNNGNIGIGTTSPDAKLAVNGNIHTKEVKVDLIGWSDFVFYDDYKLPTLEEVEKHIKENGHLKDIPSEKEVLKNGILLGEMNAKLLQKIEELTLYTIAQEKKINKKDIEFKNLSDRLASIEKLLQKK
jgi:hypothetical protein